MNRRFKFGLALAAASVAILGISRYMVHSLTRSVRVSIEDSPSNLGLKYEDVSFPAAVDGLMLRGWYVPAEKSDRCIIMTHGGAYHRADPAIGMLEIAGKLVACDYNVLMFDLRGHGESADGKMTAGYYERRDVQGAITYAKERGMLPEHIGLLGFSMGAAASLLAAAEDKELAAVVSDSCWADTMHLIESEIAKRRYLPGFVSAIMPSIAKVAYGVDIAEARPLVAVHEFAPRPILFIHGEFDGIVPVEHAMKLYHSSNNPRNGLWIVPEAEHVGSFRAHPDEYIDRVVAFFDQAMK
ncbi:MAG: alpha/beta hydrolase [Dehalococcoidia bacterium]